MTKKSITAQRFHRERLRRLSSALRGAVVFLFGIACGLSIRSLPMRFLALPLICLFLLLAAGGLLWAVHSLYLTIPRNSVFGRSVVSQGRRELRTLCDEIDGDLLEESRMAGPLAVGRKWIVGDEAMLLSRACGVFSVTMNHNLHALFLVDVDGNAQVTVMEEPQVEEAAARLREFLPKATGGGAKELKAFMELRADQRQRFRKSTGPEEPWDPAKGLAFWDREGMPTSNFTGPEVENAFQEMEAGESVGFTLTGEEIPQGAGMALFAERDPEEYRLSIPCKTETGTERAVCAVKQETALAALQMVLKTGRLPDFSRWERVRPPETQQPYQLIADRQIYRHITAEDVELTLADFTAGNCRAFSLMRPDRSTGGLFLDRAEEGGYQVMAAVPSGEGVRWLETKTARDDQIRFWVQTYYEQSVFPYLSGWEDITELMERKRREHE